jgi:hypothetical protein
MYQHIIDVRLWHFADVENASIDVRFRQKSGHWREA